MLSCDTLAVTAQFCAHNSNLLAKNSDRPLGEAQPLGYFPPQDHGDGQMVECTYISIPQAAHTYGVLGSKPYWIWGFEMGVNAFIPDDASSAGSPRPAGIFPVPQIKKVAVFQHVELEGCAGTSQTACRCLDVCCDECR